MKFNPQPKNKRIINKKYLKDINKNGCIICASQSTAHHIKKWGMGGSTKADDYMTLPLCVYHHTGDDGIHRCIKDWENKHGKQPDLIISTLYSMILNNKIKKSIADKYVSICYDLLKKFN